MSTFFVFADGVKRRNQGYFARHESFVYDRGQKNSILLRDLFGLKYVRDSKSTNKHGEDRWTCQKRLSKGCKVIIKTIGEFIVAQKNEHTCTWNVNIDFLNLSDPISKDFFPRHEKFFYVEGKYNSVLVKDRFGIKYKRESKTISRNGEIRWTCQKRCSRNCKVIIKTVGDFIISQKNEHICTWNMSFKK